MKVSIGPYPNHRFYHNWLYKWFGYSPKQKIRIKIHNYDTWSMDHTLAEIILPMLIQLKDTQHGYPNDLTEQEWNAILDEMIWAFEQKCRDDWESEYYKFEEGAGDGFPGGYKLVWENPEGRKKHQERMTNGFRLFGKYYENLWD